MQADVLHGSSFCIRVCVVLTYEKVISNRIEIPNNLRTKQLSCLHQQSGNLVPDCPIDPDWKCQSGKTVFARLEANLAFVSNLDLSPIWHLVSFSIDLDSQLLPFPGCRNLHLDF